MNAIDSNKVFPEEAAPDAQVKGLDDAGRAQLLIIVYVLGYVPLLLRDY